MSVTQRRPADESLDGRAWTRLKGRIDAALHRARATGEVSLVSVTTALGERGRSERDRRRPRAVPGSRGSASSSPTATARRWRRSACVRALEAAAGPERFAAVARRLARAGRRCARRSARRARRAPGWSRSAASPSRPTAAARPTWDGFAPGVAARARGLAGPRPRADVADRQRRGRARRHGRGSARRGSSGGWRAAHGVRCRCSIPRPSGAYEVRSPMPPSHYEEAVARAVQRIRAGELEKVVLAREVEVHAPATTTRRPCSGCCARRSRRCFVFAVGRGDATFLGASPELLVRREGQRASTVALAGSTRRSADPAVDDHLGEQLLRSDKDREENAIVARRIARALRPHAVWVTAAPEPALVQVANIQHLATPIRAQLAAPLERDRARRPAASDAGGRRRAVRRLAERLIPALGGLRPRLVRRARRLDRRRPATASSASRCAARCCAGALARLLRRLRDRRATPTRRPSWPRPRSSCRRCCRCSPARSRAARTRG